MPSKGEAAEDQATWKWTAAGGFNMVQPWPQRDWKIPLNLELYGENHQSRWWISMDFPLPWLINRGYCFFSWILHQWMGWCYCYSMICPGRLHPKLSQNHWKKQKETLDCRDVHISSLGCWCPLDALGYITHIFVFFPAWLKGCASRSQISFRTGRVVSFFGAERTAVSGNGGIQRDPHRWNVLPEDPPEPAGHHLGVFS